MLKIILRYPIPCDEMTDFILSFFDYIINSKRLTYIVFYFILLYTRTAISTQTNPKSVLVEKKTTIYVYTGSFFLNNKL